MRIALLASPSPPIRLYLYAFWLGVAALATGQDALFALLKDTSFYWSESLLYKVYWLLFIPLTIFVGWAARWLPIKKILSQNFLIHALLAISTSLIQIVVFATLIAILSEVLLGYPFHFLGVLRKSLAEDFFTGMLMYGLLLVVGQRIVEKSAESIPDEVLEGLTKSDQKIEYLSVLLVKDGAKIQRIPLTTIDWIGSEDSYTVLHRGNQKWLYSESLAGLEKQLNPVEFVRIHRSCIVNAARVRQVKSRLTGDYDVQLDNEVIVRLSRHYAQKAKGRLL
jgi:hypothetical protein